MLQPVTVLRQMKYAHDGVNIVVLSPGDIVNMAPKIAKGLRGEGFVTYEDGEVKQAAPVANKQMPPAENKESVPGTLVSTVVVPKHWKKLKADQRKALAMQLGAPPDATPEQIDAGLAAVYAGQVEKAEAEAKAAADAAAAAERFQADWDAAVVEDAERFPPQGA